MAEVTYEVDGWVKYVEEDNWEEGCIGGIESYDGSDRFHASNMPELLEKLQDFVYEGSIEVDVCDEKGRVDICRMENENGDSLTCAEETAWRKGEGKAWYAVYIFYVQKVTRETVDLTEEAGI